MDTKPSERYLKGICRVLFCTGVGDFWFRNAQRSKAAVALNDLGFVVIAAVCYAMLSLQIPVVFADNFTSAEKHDALNFTFGPGLVVTKWCWLVWRRARVRQLLDALCDESIIQDDATNVADQTKKSKFNMGWFSFSVICVCVIYTVPGVQKLSSGEPFLALYTIWPFRDDVTFTAQSIRFIYLIIFFYMMVVMVCVDGLFFTSMVNLTYKFSTLSKYFRDIKGWFENNPENMRLHELESEFRERFVTGLKFHSHILGCTRRVQETFSLIFTLTVSQCCFMVAVSLSRFMVTERSLLTAFLTIIMMGSLLTMLGIYSAHSGDLTYEGSRVSDAVYNCGWELCRHNQRQMKHLLLLGTLQGQKPLVMKAFGTYEMSYSAFVSVVKTSYSLFAVLY